jgi:hypothetical protein
LTIADYPSEAALLTALRSVVGHRIGAELHIEARQPSISGTFPKEIITLRTEHGQRHRMFVKYGNGSDHNDHGHRAGVRYESTIYRLLLRPLGIDRPEYFGLYTGHGRGHEWLFLEFLEGALRLMESTTDRALELAAEWLGWFHAACEASSPCPGIRRFDERYYAGWIDRAHSAARDLVDSHDELPDVWRTTRHVVARWLCDPETIAHSEYYPKNVLVVEDGIYPVDWESAAAAPGELDIASLTDGWPADVMDDCVHAYREARWPAGLPERHAPRLLAARAYLHCRWMARQAEKWRSSGSETHLLRVRTRFGRLHEMRRELEMIA